MNASARPLDRFIPHPDVQERFETTIRAPAAVVLQVAAGFDLQSQPLVRAIFRLREVLLRSTAASPRQAQGLLQEMRALGWTVLAQQPERFIACGASCQPWRPDVRFWPVPAADFTTYAQADRVKIAWTLEAAALGPELTRFAQETRAVATDGQARAKFRRYWRWARFGIVAIRWLMLPAIRREAEASWAAQRSA